MYKSPKKDWATFPMLNFSRWTPTLGASLKWNDQKRPKITHFGIFRHIGGSGGSEKMWTSKYSGSRVIVAKIADIGPHRAPQYFFQKKKPRTFELLYT